jgi:hypothetical protein
MLSLSANGSRGAIRELDWATMDMNVEPSSEQERGQATTKPSPDGFMET